MDATEAYMSGQMRPGHPVLLEEFQRRSDHLAPAGTLDLPYGPGPREAFDVFIAPQPWRATLAYFHAGYWQSRDKAQFRFIAQPLTKRGIDVAVVNYPLCPAVTLAGLVDAARRSIPAILAHAAGLGRGGDRLIACGHSAGGHIAVELALTAWPGPSPIAAVAALSGVYDLEPLVQTPLNARLQLDAATARAASPIHRVPGGMPPALFAVGGDETQAFLTQTARMHAAWRAAGNAATELVVPAADHFTLLQSAAVMDAIAALA